jgi:glutathione S-transferase
MMYDFVQIHITADRFPNLTRWMEALGQRPSFATTLSAQDAQLVKLSKTGLLPWLGRVLKKPRPNLAERLRLAVVRRMARRAMGAARDAPVRRRGDAPLRQPQTGAIPPADMPVRSGPAPSPTVLAEPITLYDSVDSPHARRIRILLREKSLSWQTVAVDMTRLAHKAPDFLAINPNGELPVLRHGGRVICDSQLIAEYLDRTYRGNPLYPEDAYSMAQVRMWLALEAGTHKEFRPLFYLHVIAPALRAAGIAPGDLDGIVPAGVHPSHVAWLRDALRGTPRFDTSEELAQAIIASKLDGINADLAERRYLVGDTCTMADLAWFTRVDLLPRLGVHVNAARYPNICRWFEAVAARPSVPESSHS